MNHWVATAEIKDHLISVEKRLENTIEAINTYMALYKEEVNEALAYIHERIDAIE